jgi:glycosyltransferase involved in cell wall biosynthesis
MEIIINGRFLDQAITGVQRYARELVQAIDGLLDGYAGIKVTVISPRLSGSPPRWRNIVLRQIGFLHGHAWEQFELPWYSRHKMLVCLGNTAPIIALLGAQPVIVTVHDLSYKYFPDAYHPLFRWWYSLIIPLVLHRANAVITVSQSERRAIVAHFPRAGTRLRVVENGGLPAKTSDDTKYAELRNNSILYVGSFSERKNFSRMVEVARRLARKRHFSFVFVGGTSKSLAMPIVDVPSDISSLLTFVDQIDDASTLTRYYRRAACFLFPSLYESSGLPPIEAMACGCPVIVSDIPALRERCGDAAIYCDPYDIESIAAAVERLMDDKLLRQRLELLGPQRAANFSWETCAAQTLDLIRRCIENKGVTIPD